MAFPHWITCEKCGNTYSDYCSAFGAKIECVRCAVRKFPYHFQLVEMHLSSEPEFAPVLELYKKVFAETEEVRRTRASLRDLVRLEEERVRRVEAVNKDIDAKVKHIKETRRLT